MAHSSHLFPTTRRNTSLWGLGILFIMTGVFVVLAMIGISRGSNSPWSMGVFYGVFYGGGSGIAAIHLLIKRLHQKHEENERSMRLHALGLEFQPRVTWPDLEPFFDLPLFRFSNPHKEYADSLGHGVLAGHEILVVNYRYTGMLRTKNGNRGLRGALQTIALFPRADLPDFHLTPRETDWNLLLPGWPRHLDVGRVVRVVDGDSDDPILIRSPDDVAVPLLFTEERVQQLGDLGGWTIESCDGKLVIYRHDELMNADELPYFVNRAIDLVGVLTGHTDEDRKLVVPPGDEHIQTAHPRPARQGITEFPPPAGENA